MFPFEISIIMLKIPKYVFFKRNYYYTQKINKTKKNNTVVLKIIVPSLNERVLSWLLLLNLTIITSVPPTTSFRCNVFTSKIKLQFNTVLNFKKKYSIMWTGNAFITRAQREWESIENFPYKMVHAENIWSMRHLFTQQGVLTEATKYAPSFFFNFTEQTNKWHKVLVRHALADSHTIS